MNIISLKRPVTAGLLSRSFSDHQLRCGGWLNLEFSKREKHLGWAIQTIYKKKSRHAKTHTSGPYLPEHLNPRRGLIRNTCPCDSYPLTPHFYNYNKIGVYRGIHNFLIFALKHRLWVLVRTASLSSLRRF